MNENIGAKGGIQDRRRSFKIKKRNLEKLKRKKQKRDLNILKRNDIKTFFRIIPIAILGESFKVIFGNSKKQQRKTIIITPDKIKKSNKHEKNIIEIVKKKSPSIITTIPQKRKEHREQINEMIPIDRNKTTKSDNNLDFEKKKKQQKKEQGEKQEYYKQKTSQPNQRNNKIITTFSLSHLALNNLKKHPKEIINVKTKYLQFKEKKSNKNKKNSNNYQEKPIVKGQKQQKKINRIIDTKIIEEYTKKLYDIRYSLKKLIYEYHNLVVESDDIYTKEQAEILLYKLNIIIKKIEELKQKIKIEDIDKYDDSYIYNLVNEYLKEFKDRKFIEEIKDSDLYITLSEKIQELDIEKEKLENKLELRKEKIASDEKDFEIIKKEFDIFAKFDQDLIKFQNEQIYLLKELESNIENSLTITEKVEKEVKAMNNRCKKLLELIALQMMIPKLKGTKNIITSTMIYMYYMRKILHPEVKTKKYKIINITDYSNDIENSLYQINNITEKLKNTSQKLNSLIKEFEEKYKEYFDIIPECKNLLYNLKKVQSNLREKEYEINKLKQQQQKNLETNNEKVKRLNNKIEPFPQKKEKKYS